MKILAVRGLNLASLEGEFAVDFSTGILGVAGLIAIAGPTGAGKTTLLDTVCLALYHKLPRHEGFSDQAQVGRTNDTLSPSDPRNLMRKGASDCYAEVDFLAVDGRKYRARWGTKRSSRGQRSLQAAKAELRELDGDNSVVAGSVTEVRRVVPELIGLSFDQFRRSVMLAQGEFASFLRAPAADRSALLESITGTGIYTLVGKLAHGRARSAAEHEGELRNRIQAIPLMEQGERTTLEQRIVQLEIALTAGEKRWVETQREQDWHQKLAGLTAALIRAKVRADSALTAQQGSVETVRLLKEVQIANALRPVYSNVQARRSELDEARAREAEAALNVRRSNEQVSLADQAAASARVKFETFDAEYEKAGIEMDEAKELDGKISHENGSASKLGDQVRQLAEELTGAESEVVETQGRLTTLHAAVDDSRAWLNANPAVVRLRSQWLRVEDRLQQAVSALTGSAGASDLLAMTLARSAANQNGLELLEASLLAQNARVLELESGMQEEEAQATAFNRDSLTKLERTHTDRRQALGGLREDCDSLQGLVERHGEEIARSEAQSSQARTLRASATSTRALVAELRLRKDEADRMAKHLQKVQDLESRRHQLIDGEPCPLCGSLQHPYSTGSPADADPTWERVRELDAEIQDATASVATMSANAEAAERSAAEATASAEKIEKQIDSSIANWTARASSMGISGHPMDKEITVVLDQLQGEAEAAVAKARLELAAANSAQAHLQAARVALEEQRELTRAVGVIVDCLRKVNNEVAHVPKWPAGFVDDPEAFVAELTEAVRACESHTDLLASATKDQQALEPTLAAAKRNTQFLKKRRDELEVQLSSLRQEIEGLRERREQMLGGQSVGDFRARMEAKKKSLAADHKTKRDAVEGARKALAAAQAGSAGATSVAIEAAGRVERAERDLSGKLQARELNECGLVELLAYDESWIGATAKRMEEIANEAGDAGRERKRADKELQDHRDALAPQHSADECRSEGANLETQLKGMREEKGAVNERLRRDEQDRAARVQLEANLAALRAESQVWLQLNDLVGSAQGDKLRNFVQGLTFEVLLAIANRRLKDLRPQYSLERVPPRPGRDRDELELQIVDHYAADEVRPASSLSGGETFLVSIALALALSTISARDARIESLFIDEGFGSLDAETLEVAMTALEQLGGEDKQITIISHIDSLTERVDACVQVLPLGPGRSRVVVCE